MRSQVIHLLPSQILGMHLLPSMNGSMVFHGFPNCKESEWHSRRIYSDKTLCHLQLNVIAYLNKAYRPNAHLLYIVMPYNGSII